jgi:predicted acylesterase/phospholipase RssA
VGVSSGAIISLLYMLGYTLDEIERLSLQLDFTSFAPSFEPDMLLSLYTSWGLDTGATAERFIRSLFTTKGLSPESSFADLYKKGIRFRCYATEIQTAKIKEFSYKETPTTQVAFAIRASISLPVIFTPVRDSNGRMYVDGGIIHNTPFAFLSQEEIKYSLGIHFDTSTSSIGDVSMLDACKSLYTSMTRLRNESLLKKYRDYLIYVPMLGELPIRDSYSFEYKNHLIKIGERACKAFLKERPLRRPRRFSAM